ncbi:MAG: hypothetical protein VX641_01835 [Planctomycetota bacterium]|nr:hypothetical protein [Planctomycetota bacterium]
MPWQKTLTTTLIVLLAFASGCSRPGPGPEEMKKVNQKLNQTTMSISLAVKSMWTTEEFFMQEQLDPRKVDLETWWISLTSTRLNMKRVLEIITTHPSTIELARNFWAGRIQEYLDQIIGAGLLGSMPGPITSRLAETYGAERVQKEAGDVLELTRRIETTLGIERTPASTDG